MSSGPSICCILPAHQRPDFVERSIRCFVAQDYPDKKMLLLNTSSEMFGIRAEGVSEAHRPGLRGKTVGWLRNYAIGLCQGFDLIAHFDYDDWSDPGRLSQQVALMELTGRPVAGYYDMIFHDVQKERILWYDSMMRNYSLGTALIYRRSVWERTRFPDATPEDTTWQRLIGHGNIAAISSVKHGRPMMIQTLHGTNGAASANKARFQEPLPDLEQRTRDILAGH